MGAGRGAARRASNPFVHGTLRRAKLEPQRRGRVVYTSYLEALRYRCGDGDAYWVYIVDEYGMSASTAATTATNPVLEYWRRLAYGPGACPPPTAMRSYATLVGEDDLFWVVGADDADLEQVERDLPRAPLDPVPVMDAIYWSAYQRGPLRERDDERCRVYAMEERSAGKGRRVPARYGIRFPDDNTYWVVPANEIVLAPTYRRP
jgi:hypothetical protein